MKKLITLFTLLFLTLTTIAQTAHARAYEFRIGKRDYYTNEIVWNGSTNECNILIKLTDNKVTIFSKTQQEYYVVGKLAEMDNTAQYRMQDANGISCNFYMGPTEIDGVLFMIVEYSDYAWMYFVVPEK